MAKTYLGANNLNYLVPNGTFGNRSSTKAAAARYIRTCVNPIMLDIFDARDFDILIEQFDEDRKIEPQFLAPIIPMVIVNGAVGIGTGYSTTIPMYSPIDVTECIINYIKKGKYTQISPSWTGYKGTITQIDESTFMVKG